MACQQHQALYKKHLKDKSRSNVSGLRRVLQRPAEQEEWQQPARANLQPHDEPEDEEAPRKHYFSPNRFYCIETMTAPCGVVIAWTKFAKSESPTKILDFLEKVFPIPALRPAYVCIDKACQVLRTAAVSGRWNSWKRTTRFIVDTYHYINHRKTDWLCREYCNPAPRDGSAPNLVGIRIDANGRIFEVSLISFI